MKRFLLTFLTVMAAIMPAIAGAPVLAFSESEITLAPGESQEVHLVLQSLDETVYGYQLQFIMYDINHSPISEPVALDYCYGSVYSSNWFNREGISCTDYTTTFGRTNGNGSYYIVCTNAETNEAWPLENFYGPDNVLAFTVKADAGWNEEYATLEVDLDYTKFSCPSGIFMLTEPLVLTIRNSNFELPKTETPIVETYADDGFGSVSITSSEEDYCEIYFRYNKDYNGWSDWFMSEGVFYYELYEPGNYSVEAYAIAEGKLASDIVSASFVINTPITERPVLECLYYDDYCVVNVSGYGEIKLYKDGILVDNPCIVYRSNTDQTILFTATAQIEGWLISETASMTVIVPAKEVEPGEGYRLEKVWEINDLSFMTTTDVRQGFGMNDRYYINNKTNQTVLVFNENGLTETTYPGGTNCSLTRDEVGNIITCNTEFSFAWTEATIKVVNPKTNEMKEYTVPKKCGVLGRCDFIGFAKGNLMEDGALYLAGATNTGISVMTIADGEVSIDECYAATCDGLTPSSSTVINYYNDQTGEDALLYVTRNATPNANKLTALDDDHVSSTPVLLSGKGPSNGTFPFIWEGKEYFLYPYKAAGESNYLDGFAIAEADAEPIVVVPATVATPVNGFQCNWLNAEVNANSVTIYQYYPGGHITVYRLTDLSAPVIEKTDAPEIRSEVNEDYVEVTAIGKGNVILYVDDLIVDNPYYVSRSEHDFYVTASATAKEEGKLISETTTLEIFIPAKEVDPGETFIPKDVTVVPATTTADVTWEDSHNTGWNLRYREVLPGIDSNLLWDFEEDTNGNSDKSLPGGWTCIDADGDGYEWFHLNDTPDLDYANHSGIGHVTSASYVHTTDSTGRALTPDNWLVSPRVKIDGELSFWACGQDPNWASEVFRVYTSTDKVNWVPVSDDITATGEMTEYTFDLTPYACQNGYVAIRHYNVTDMFRLNVDDIAITYVKPAEWVYVVNLDVPYYTIEGLTPGTNYEVQVQGINNYEVTSDWTESIQFTTLVLLGDVNGDGWVSITDLNAMLNIIFYDGAFVVAADMNKDLIINVQDVVGLVHYLLNGEIPTISSNGRRAPKAQAAGQACLYWQDGVLYLNSDVPVSALNIINDVDGDIIWNLDDYGMVVMQSTGAQGEHSVIFSFDRSTIPTGVIAIATTNSHNPRVVGAELSNLDSELIPVNLNDQLTGLTSIQNGEMFNCHMDGSCLVINSGAALRDIDVSFITIDGRVLANQHLSFLNSGGTSIDMSDILKGNSYLIIVVRNGQQILATQKLTQNK